MGFYDVYKEWRNRARKFRPESVVFAAMHVLREPAANNLEDLKRAPWQVMLLVKWVCQDSLTNQHSGRNITLVELGDLRQRLWEFPEHVHLGTRDTLPIRLFFRQLIHAQIGFQRAAAAGFLREAALLAKQRPDHPLRIIFEKKTGINILDFIDLTFATYSAILDGNRQLDVGWFEPMRVVYSTPVINAYISCISRTFPELVTFCRSLPNSQHKVASELYEFPVLSRYPFFRVGDTIECWHPAVFYRGMEGIVHSILSEEGHDYIRIFSKMFERHVIAEAQKVAVPFLDENALRIYLPDESKVPDGLLSFPGCNIFIESKSGIFDESVMTVGHSEMFAGKTKALKSAVTQAWSASVYLRHENRAPANVLSATRDYLLIVTNKELSASRGSALASMYPPGTLEYPSPEAARFLPLDHIYVLSIEDFERLIAGTSDTKFDLPVFLDECVQADQIDETSVHFFEQHLDRKKVPRQYSELVNRALDDALSRIEKVFNHRGKNSK